MLLIEHTASAVSAVFLVGFAIQERKNFFTVFLKKKKHFKISASGLFLKYFYNFANFNLNIIVKYFCRNFIYKTNSYTT